MADTNRNGETWVRRITHEIVDTGSAGPGTIENLDNLLIWLNGKSGPTFDLITDAFAARSIPAEDAKILVLSALDNYLFPGEKMEPLQNLGLQPESSYDDIKKRYSRLIQVYHPDKQILRGEWVTARAEAINAAYAHLKQEARNAQERFSYPDTAEPEHHAGAGQEYVYPNQRVRVHF